MAEGEYAWFQHEGEKPEAEVLHAFGRLKFLKDDAPFPKPPALGELPADLTVTEGVGLAVLAEEASDRFARARDDMRFEGRSWDEPAVKPDDPPPLDCDRIPELDDMGVPWRALGAPRLQGDIAVASFFVSGPGALAFGSDEVVGLQAQVKAGMTLMNGLAPLHDLRFAYVIEQGPVDAAEAPAGTPAHTADGFLNVEPFERGWRDAFLARLGLPAGTRGLQEYAGRLRDQGADWAFVNLFSKYRLAHHAYTMSYVKISLGMRNDWGASKVFRVVAHEMGHVFGAPDEYGRCTCGGSHGPFGVPNENCVNCAGGGADCLMRNNAPVLCRASTFHLGFSGLVAPVA